MKIIKKYMLAFFIALTFVLSFGLCGEVHANTNFEGQLYGFSIDEDVYDVTWTNTRSSAYYKGEKIGITYLYQGKAIAKEKINGKYCITYLTAVKTCPQIAEYSRKILWWRDYWKEYGYNTTCELDVSLASGSTLLDSYPKYTVSDTSYSIGVGAGVDSSGLNASISGSVNFTDEAIKISNSSSTSKGIVDININLNEPFWRWDWKRLKYAQQENFQLFSFTVLSDSKYSCQYIRIKTEYGTMDNKASYWTNINCHYESCTTSISI